ncbi:7-carboxy-7-deazaguanine synthase QueE [Helicobacter cappadocius]|uniref:7-carboxy-7-deazaguanine synthase n=1 Tax=Helicobacter cappadocius TaxID=3063998 RepID=A0AA90PHL0_9HELI|nr:MULTISPECIES: 7-carboxy-7-deazaguanine synthase QueE [unclassified Helicobacter]MDO7252560.1 7-carboxy-7-deazaguanine synthase QueE [Helicobacter sp. faydin-H75]MDP2538427.1 7-carboxy-7-deazaguanine synthase QueE [Helicobacter sp. faydin-H76]
MLGISEIFYSLQGEGEFIGTPSIFVRLGGCNLKCTGFGNRYEGSNIIGCDSIYAANAKFSKEWIFFQNSQELISSIQSFSTLKSDIVITGGEPTLQFKNPILLQSIAYFLKEGHRVCVESNGSIKFIFDEVLKELYFTLSVKLSNSAEPFEKRINIQAIQNIIDNAKSVVFKFVLNAQMCEDGSAIREIKDLLSKLKLKNNRVYLMPQGVSVAELDKNIEKIYPLCLQEGFSLTDRIHIRIWGDKRGV